MGKADHQVWGGPGATQPGQLPGMMPGDGDPNRANGRTTVAPQLLNPDPLMQSIISTPNPGPDPAVLAVAVQQEQQELVNCSP